MTAKKTTSNKPSQKNASQPVQKKKDSKAVAKTSQPTSQPDLSMVIKGRPTKERNAITNDDVLTFLGIACPKDKAKCDKHKDGNMFKPIFGISNINGKDTIAFSVNLSHQTVYRQTKTGSPKLTSNIGTSIPTKDIDYILHVIDTSSKWASERNAIKAVCHVDDKASLVGNDQVRRVVRARLNKIALDTLGTYHLKVGCDIVFALHEHFMTDDDYAKACKLANTIKSQGAQLSNVMALPSA